MLTEQQTNFPGPSAASSVDDADLDPELDLQIPAHAAVLIATSEYFRRYLESWHPGGGAGGGRPRGGEAAGGDGGSAGSGGGAGGAAGRSRIMIEVEPGELQAAHLMLRYMYTGELPSEGSEPGQLITMVQLADRFSVNRFLARCNSALAEMPLQRLTLDHVIGIFHLPPFLWERPAGQQPGQQRPAGQGPQQQQQRPAGLQGPTAAAQAAHGSAVDPDDAAAAVAAAAAAGPSSSSGGAAAAAAGAPPLAVAVRRAQEKLAELFGDLEAAWADPGRRRDFLRLPLPAVQYLLSRDRTAVYSENTVLVALCDWLHHDGRLGPAAGEPAQRLGRSGEAEAAAAGGGGSDAYALGGQECGPLAPIQLQLGAATFSALGERLAVQRADVPGFVDDEVPYGVYDFFRLDSLHDAVQLEPYTCPHGQLHLSCRVSKCV
ncbi:hypothetical protein GPECTOR_58g542 [Gonium pectorale]|uniref:BTB domain-containing protein n=1 Tax=Gonium pectorale TaxID=33097 RepID=A0A150G5P9_GONPE|nr:hypothetical protein GPECTOR_58g542 [Gonium pectorale]|eukprot:KXZ45093.1 hypothetical protein GPECTOR_58g542 [Gonium pectorale]